MTVEARRGVQATSRIASSSNLPIYKPKGIDVGTLEGVKVLHVDGFVQHFWSHVPGIGETVTQRTRGQFSLSES